MKIQKEQTLSKGRYRASRLLVEALYDYTAFHKKMKASKGVVHRVLKNKDKVQNSHRIARFAINLNKKRLSL